MFGLSSWGRPFETIAERMRRHHSAWLTRAIRRGGGKSLPRIPVRLVSEGGFDPLMNTFEGREWAEAWWNEALEGEGE
jgi:hypothetical protein